MAKFLEKEHKLLIDGRWVAAKSGKTFPVEDPAMEETIAHVPAGDRERNWILALRRHRLGSLRIRSELDRTHGFQISRTTIDKILAESVLCRCCGRAGIAK